jgi:hypothetical protein
LCSLLRLPSPELDPIPILAARDPRYTASRRTDRRHRFLYCCDGVFTEPLILKYSKNIQAYYTPYRLDPMILVTVPRQAKYVTLLIILITYKLSFSKLHSTWKHKESN